MQSLNCGNIDSTYSRNTQHRSIDNIQPFSMHNDENLRSIEIDEIRVYPNDSNAITNRIDENNTVNTEQSSHEITTNVSNTDDPNLPCLTLHSICLGLLFTCLLAFIHQCF